MLMALAREGELLSQIYDMFLFADLIYREHIMDNI